MSLGCDLCLPVRPGFIQTTAAPGRYAPQWAPCPRCNPAHTDTACTGCYLCLNRQTRDALKNLEEVAGTLAAERALFVVTWNPEPEE